MQKIAAKVRLKKSEFNCQLSQFDFNLECFLVGALYFLGLVFISLHVLAPNFL